MSSYQELVAEYPELGDIIARFENEISYLHNSMPNTEKIYENICSAPDEPWSKRQWDYVQQLHGLVLHLQRQLNEHLDKSKKKRTPIKKKYIYKNTLYKAQQE